MNQDQRTIQPTIGHSGVSSQHDDKWDQDMMGPPAYVGCYLIDSRVQQDRRPSPQNEQTSSKHFDVRHYAHPYQMCGSLCAKSTLHEAYSYYGYNEAGACICSNSLPSASNLVEDVHCRKHECNDRSSTRCAESASQLIQYWAVLSANPTNIAVSLDSSTSPAQRKLYSRGMPRKSLSRTLIARDDPLNQAMGEPDQITTESSKSFDPSPNSIFSGQSISQTPTTDPVPIVAVAMACISLGLGIFCLFVALNRLNQLRRHQKEHPEPILPETNNRSVCTKQLRKQESLQEELSVNIQTLFAPHRVDQLLVPSQPYRQTTRAGFSPILNEKSMRGTLRDGVRVGKASYVTRHLGEYSPEMDAKEFIESQFLSHDCKDVHLLNKPFEIEGNHVELLKNRRILDIQAAHAYRNQTSTYDYSGSNANQERDLPSKVDVLSSPTNSNFNSKSSSFLNPSNACGTGSVVSPEKLARESYPHRNIVASGTKVSSIAPITRNSWMMKHPPSLKLKESLSNCSLNSSSDPQPVRKLKASFGVGLEPDRLDVTPEVPHEVENSPQNIDFFNLGSSHGRNRSCVPKADFMDSVISESTHVNRLTLDLDEHKRFSSSTRLGTIESPTVASHCGRSDSNSNILPFPSRETMHGGEKNFLNQGTPYPSLGLPKLVENDCNSNQCQPVKPAPKINGLLNFGNMLRDFTHSPSSKSKIDSSTETHSEEDLKRPSAYVPPKLNWTRRRKIISGNWKRLNSVTTPTRSPLTSSISSDALSQGYMKKGGQAHSDLNHSLKAYADSSFEVKQERLRNRHKYSKSVPDMSFLTQLHSDDENEYEPKQLNIMNPDQPSLSESARSLSPCELQEERTLDSPTKFPLHNAFLGRHRDSEDYSSLSSSSGDTSTAINKLQANSVQVGSPNLNQFVNHLGYEEFKTQLGIRDYQPRSRHCRTSDPILYGKWSEAIEVYRNRHPISSKSCGNLLSKSTFQTSEKKSDSKVRKPTLEIRTAFLKNETFDGHDYQDSPSKNRPFLHPIYNLPMTSRPDHSESIDKREPPIHSIPNYNQSPIVSNQTSSQESYSSAHPGPAHSNSPIHATDPSTPIATQPDPEARKLNQEEDESIPFFSRPRKSTSILKLTDRHLSLGGISTHSSEDLSSFCTGAASLNSEPQWKSRLNSVGSFATNQSFEEQRELWVANPDRFYSPSLESIFNPSSRLNLSPVPGRASGSVNC